MTTIYANTADFQTGRYSGVPYDGLGVRGADVPSTGEHGPGYLYDSLSLPADSENEYRGPITSGPTAGGAVVIESFVADYDSNVLLTVSGGDGTVTWNFDLIENNVNLGSVLVTVNIGATVKVLLDAGNGVDGFTPPSVTVIAVDAGSGVDLPPGSSVVSQLSDVASALDVAGLSAVLTLAETGAGTDAALPSVSLLLGDAGFGADAGNVIADTLKLLADLGGGADQLSVSSQLSLVDAAAGSDQPLLSVSLGLVDAASAADSLSVITDIIKRIADVATAFDGLSASGSMTAADAGSGADVPLLNVGLSIADTGSAAETLSVIQQIIKILSDIAAGLDAVSLSVNVPLADAAAGMDDAGLQAVLQAIDAAGGVDMAAIVQPSAARLATVTFTLRPRNTVFTLKDRNTVFTLQ